MSLSLSSCYAPFKLLGAFYYGYTQVNYSSLELIVAFSVFVNAIFAGDGFIYVSCSGEYFKCAISLDRLGVSSMHLDILIPDTVLRGSTIYLGFGSSSPCVFNLFVTSERWAQPSLCSSKVPFLINTPGSISVKFRCGFILSETCCNLFLILFHI